MQRGKHELINRRQHVGFSVQPHRLGRDITDDAVCRRTGHALELYGQGHLLGGQHRHLGLYQAGAGAYVAVLHQIAVVVVQLYVHRLHHRSGRAADIHRQLGAADIQQIVPLGAQRQHLGIQHYIAGKISLSHLADDLTLHRHFLRIQLAHRHRDLAQAGLLHADIRAYHSIREADGPIQLVYAHGIDAGCTGNDPHIIPAHLHQFPLRTAYRQINGGVISGQQHQIFVCQRGVLAGELHRDIPDGLRPLRRLLHIHIYPQRQGHQDGDDDLHGLAAVKAGRARLAVGRPVVCIRDPFRHGRPPPFCSVPAALPVYGGTCPPFPPPAVSAHYAAACPASPASGAA